MSNIIEFPKPSPSVSELDMALANVLEGAHDLFDVSIREGNQDACTVAQQIILMVRGYGG